MEEPESLRKSQRTRRPRERYGFSPETIERRRASTTNAVQVEQHPGPGGAVEDEEDGQMPGGLQSQDDPPPGDTEAPPGHTLTWQEEGLPGWAEAHSSTIPTMKHIPKAAREEWARILGATIGDVCADPSPLKEVVTALHSASLCAQGDAKGGSILRQVGGTGGEGGLQEVEIWRGSLSLEGSSQGTTSATKEGKEESWEC